MRCSPLNAALALGWHQRSKVLVFIGFFSLLYTGSNVPFMFAPVALYALFSLLFHHLLFLTFGLFLWCGFFSAEMFSSKLGFFEAAVQVQSPYPWQI
ncbi:hypothetical protein FORC72_1657 [Vibrio parahaemolyticus]|nr:hypothetical protein FORC72_1657 [Vibrio parahaemolyticus]